MAFIKCHITKNKNIIFINYSIAKIFVMLYYIGDGNINSRKSDGHKVHK